MTFMISPLRLPIKLLFGIVIIFPVLEKVTLINSVLMSIVQYHLSCYLVPDTILDFISKLARTFLWNKSGNRSGINLIGWNRAMTSKIKGGLGIHNL